MSEIESQPRGLFYPDLFSEVANDVLESRAREIGGLDGLFSRNYTEQSSAIHRLLNDMREETEVHLDRHDELESVGRSSIPTTMAELAQAEGPLVAVVKLPVEEETAAMNKYALASIWGIRHVQPNKFQLKVMRRKEKVLAHLTTIQIGSDQAQSQIRSVNINYDLQTERVSADPYAEVALNGELNLDVLEPYPSTRVKKAVGAAAGAGVVTVVAVGARMFVPRLRK